MTCVNGYDSITQADGTPLSNHYDYPDSNHVVTSHCRTADGTWIAWVNAILGDGIDAYGATAYGDDQDKADWPSLIASSYAVGVGFFPDDGSGPVVYSLGVDPIYYYNIVGVTPPSDPCAIFPFLGDFYADTGRCQLTGWSMGVQDVQVRTDGTNVWVVALANESVKYPYLYNSPVEVDNCGGSHPTFEEYWAAGHSDPFYHDADAGHHWWLYGPGVFGGGKPFGDYDDPGPSSSFRWQPARVTVWCGDLGGFTRLDTVEAKFNNTVGIVGDVQVAASPAEPGVCHVVWSETGNLGVQTVAPQRGQRVNYSRWDTGGKIVDNDLLYAQESGSGQMSDANWVWTADVILRNDHGSPVAIAWPWELNNGPVNLGPAELWDLSSGSIDSVRTMDEGLYPTNAEFTPLSSTGVVRPVGSLAPTGGLAGRIQFASSIYVDPTKNDTEVYLVCVKFGLTDGTGSAAVTDTGSAFYRIPCDGSGDFEYMDGTREVGYSIVQLDQFMDVFGEPDFRNDFVSDPGNVWMPAHDTGGGAVLHLDRQCLRGWTLVPCFPVPDPASGYEDGDWAGQASVPSLVTDGSGDWLYGGGTGPQLTVLSSDPTNVAALKAKICRCCSPCNRTGLHVWQVL